MIADKRAKEGAALQAASDEGVVLLEGLLAKAREAARFAAEMEDHITDQGVRECWPTEALDDIDLGDRGEIQVGTAEASTAGSGVGPAAAAGAAALVTATASSSAPSAACAPSAPKGRVSGPPSPCSGQAGGRGAAFRKRPAAAPQASAPADQLAPVGESAGDTMRRVARRLQQERGQARATAAQITETQPAAIQVPQGVAAAAPPAPASSRGGPRAVHGHQLMEGLVLSQAAEPFFICAVCYMYARAPRMAWKGLRGKCSEAVQRVRAGSRAQARHDLGKRR
ncbi:unnamed protein product [Prorocentrum cordatum]|uniref:Uncharacterized protein n=1 Tax=Prorocentrum cordatum TaxID=2364126 RepID=A0ABN9VBD8_9DINO|nr:unnamed protein product [Polarella glacialis]|mmetsp:Transcript_39176/g.102124  ORF Transcript_39176/g.102124 Transcript_39176/m.102124 type:complete len:283 (+) Transcript_39176:370-1218(+)